MAARVVVGGISHETCTYADATTGLTTLDDFFSQQSGAEVLAANRGASTAISGIVSAAEARGLAVVPTFAAYAEPAMSPAGPVSGYRAAPKGG